MVFVPVAITLMVIESIYAEECSHVISTNFFTRHINYTGGTCKWKIIAPESHRIVFNLRKFVVESPDADCTISLKLPVWVNRTQVTALYRYKRFPSANLVYDEESAAEPICPDFVGSMEYVTHQNTIYLNVTNESGGHITTLFEATFYSAEEHFSCDFHAAAVCTGHVAERSSWMYTDTGNDVCAGLTTGQSLASGKFYQAAYSESRLHIWTLLPGRYVFDAKIVATCSMRDFRQVVLLNFCNITRRYSLQDFYYQWSTFLEFVECKTDFEVTFYASPGAMVVAMDSIRLMKVIDEEYIESTMPTTTTTSLITADFTESSGLQQRRILTCVCSAVIFFLVTLSVGCILFCKRRHKVNELSENEPRVKFDKNTYDNPYAKPTPVVTHQYYEQGNNGYSMIDEAEYQAVNDIGVPEGSQNTLDVTHLGYESMLPGVQGQEKALSENEYVLEQKVEDGTYYISNENEYQMMNTSISPDI